MSNSTLKTVEEKLQSLIADEAKQVNMMIGMQSTLKQMQAKSTFRLALLNQLLEEHYDKYSGN
jgi:hypothetical protein